MVSLHSPFPGFLLAWFIPDVKLQGDLYSGNHQQDFAGFKNSDSSMDGFCTRLKEGIQAGLHINRPAEPLNLKDQPGIFGPAGRLFGQEPRDGGLDGCHVQRALGVVRWVMTAVGVLGTSADGISTFIFSSPALCRVCCRGFLLSSPSLHHPACPQHPWRSCSAQPALRLMLR